MIFLIIHFQFIFTEIITEFTSNTNKEPHNWQDSSNQLLTSTIICQQQFITPFLGPINENIHKLYTNLKPHYALAISIDILYFGYWNNNSNYFRALLDSQTIINLQKIKSASFSLPSTYCENVLITAFSQLGYSTYIAKIQHSELTLLLELQSTFNCKPQGCEQYAIKNLILDIYECHQSCLTCSGPEFNNCLTCPSNALPIGGVCSCNPIISYNYSCVDICPNLFYNKDGICLQDCPTICTQCTLHKCTQCQSNYFIEDEQCVLQCSFNKYQNQNQCTDIKQQALFGSDYLGKYFYKGSHFYEDIQNFEYVPSTNGNLQKYSFLTNQTFSFFQDQFMLGGWSVFSGGSMQFTYNDIPAHYQLRIKFNAIYIDNWNGQQIIVELDNKVIYQKSITTSTNFIQLDNPDFTEEIDIRVKHTSNTALFSISPQLTIPSYEASFGLNNLIVLYEKCNENLQEYECSSCKSPSFLLKGYCITDLTKYFRNSDTTCISGYYDVTNVLKCEKCNDRCKTCTTYSECTECQIPYSGLTDCSKCIDGYYQSGNLCFQCSSNCKLCDNYQICVQCLSGYYLDDNYKCQPCSSHCLQCNKSECLQCDSYYYNVNNNCQMCGTGFLIIDSKCLQCNQRCLVCEEQQDKCLYCNKLRTNPPYCECQYGYFEEENLNCLQCASQCSQCQKSSNNCITCAANRVNPPNCECPIETLSEIENVCTNCENAYIQAQFSDQLDDIIINFTNHLSPETQLCKMIFRENTLNLLGENPVCNVDQQYLIISLGDNASINVFSSLQFKIDSLRFEGCNKYIQAYQNNLIYQPNQQLTPQLTLNFPDEIFYYQKNQILITQQLVNGQRNLILLGWRTDPDQNIDIPSEVESIIDDLNTQLSTYKFSFKQLNFGFHSKITFQLQYQNFLGQYGITDLSVNFNKSQDQLLVNLHSSLGKPFYINNLYNLIIEPYIYDLYQQKEVDQVIFVQLDLQLTLNNKIVDELQLNGETGQYFNYQMNTTNFSSSNSYYLQITFKNIQNSTLSVIRKQISITEQKPYLKIIGGNKSISYNYQNKIKAVLYNLTDTNFTSQWSCINIIDSSYCKNSESSILQLNQTNVTLYDDSEQALVILQIPAYTFNAYQTVQLALSIHFRDYIIEDSIIVIIEEDDIPQIDIVSHNFKQKYNYYDQLYFKFKYDVTNVNTDLLTFIGTIYQNTQVIHQQKYFYLEITLSLWEFISNDPETLIFKFTVFNPNYIKTSQINIELLLNKPPINCQIQTNNQSAISLQDNIEVNIKNCMDDDQPLMYRYIIYKSKEDYQNDQKDSTVKKGKIISHYSYNSSISFQLPGIDETYLLIMVQDANYGITNLTSIFINNITNTDHQQRYNAYLSNLNQNNLIMKTHLILLDMEEFNYYDQTTLTNLINELNNMQTQNVTRTQQQEIDYLISQIQIKSNITLTINELNRQLQKISYSCELIYVNMSKIINNQAKNSIQNQNKQDKEQLYQQFEILNNLIKLNHKLSTKQNRILQDSQSNKDLIFNSIYSINNSTLIQQVINGPNSIMNGSEIQMINAKLSALQAKQQMNLNNVNQSISFSQQYYLENPYEQDQDYQEFKKQYQSINYPLYAAQISNIDNSSVSSSGYSINYAFNLSQSIQELQVECASLYNRTWTAELCQTEKQENNTILCICKNLSPTTILEAAQKISQDFMSLFTLEALQEIKQHNYISEIYIYIIMVETIFYIWGLFQAKRLDYRQNNNNDNTSRIYPQRQYPPMQTSVLKTDNQLKTDRIEKVAEVDADDKQFSFKRQPHKLYPTKIQRRGFNNNDNEQNEEPKEKQIFTSMQSERVIFSRLNHPESQCSLSEIGSQRSGMQKHQNKIDWKKSFLLYIKLFHKVIGLYYRYDPKLSRITRLTLIYISFIGQIALHAFFGQIFNLNTLIALSFLSFIFGSTYKRIVAIGLESENKIIYNLTFNFTILSFLTFYYIILASIALNKSEFAQIIWPFTYLVNLFLDLCVYSLLLHLGILCIVRRQLNNLCLKKLAKILFQQQELEFLFCQQEQGSSHTLDTKTIL